MSALVSALLFTSSVLPQPTSLDGNNVIYDGTDTHYFNATTMPGLPMLPKATRMVTMGPATSDGFDGFLTIGGHLSLTPGASFYKYGVQMRRVMEIFADWVNTEHGGVAVGANKLALRFVWVDDRSDKTQVMNATAVALRTSSADFAWAGYSSGLTGYTTMQTHADGYLMMSGGAASTSVFTKNDMSFGLFPPASGYTTTALQNIAEAADAIDAGTSTWPWASKCGDGSGCKASIKVGFVQAAAGFTQSQCAGAPANARANGLTVATAADGTDLVMEIPKAPTLEEAKAALQTLRDAGVNVVTSCTYSSTANKLIDGLYNMSWSPYALTVSATVGTQGFADRVGGAQGYKAEYVMGYEIWHGSMPRVGSFSGLTSAEFVDRFAERFDGAKPSYHGAAQFGVGISLVKAIENAASLDPNLVAAELRTLNLPEFYTDISFDANGQLEAPMLVLQFQANYSKVASPEGTITFPVDKQVKELQFPMPDWPIRDCWDTCNGVTGHCIESGECVCAENYQGATCEEYVVVKEDKEGLIIMAAVLGPILFLLLCFGAYRFALFIKKALELKKKEEARKIARCRASIKAAVTLQSPAYLVSFKAFKDLGKLTMHEAARKGGLLHSIDEYEELVDFSTKHPVIFFSHQWLAWSEPDPDKIQYNEMIESALELCKRNNYNPENLYIFLDILSIPQRNMRQRMCAIETLGCFASIFEHFVVIAPDSVHKDTHKPCNKDSYGRRGWCRLEQWGHMCVSGTDGMYFYNGPAKKLQPLDDTPEDGGADWFLDSIMVFEGDYTNPDGKAELVDTILGLYAMVLNAKDSTTKKLNELIDSHHKRVFPPQFFEDLPQMLSHIINSPGHRFAQTAKAADKHDLSTLQKSSAALSKRVSASKTVS